MTIHPLTPEQEQVVQHPIGQHARVLSSGRQRQVHHHGASHPVPDPGTLGQAFQHPGAHVQCISPQAVHRPSGQGWAAYQPAARSAHLPLLQLPAHQPDGKEWDISPFHPVLAGRQGRADLAAGQAVRSTTWRKASVFPTKPSIQKKHSMPSACGRARSFPPQRAGSHTSPYLPLAYAEFETLRKTESALTFDDFIPLAVDILQTYALVQQQVSHPLRFLIIDEYQDINYGQQKLIELLAGDHADVMVVGDDDQTIYEWRGARPNYILRDFAQVFHAKAVLDYRLSRSFRFGPLIAQCAANVIHCNETRVEKPLIASQADKPGFIQIYSDGYGAIHSLTDQVVALTQIDGVPAKEIIILARLYAQLNNLEAEFLRRKIPYRLDGQEPFFKRQEIKTLLDYLRLANAYDHPFTKDAESWLLSVANKPSRMLSRSILNQLITTARFQRLSLRMLRQMAAYERNLGLNGWQTERLLTLLDFLQILQVNLQEGITQAGELLDWMVQELGYLDYFQDYYGKGEHAEEKKILVTNFIQYVSQLRLKPLALLDHVHALDTTQGMPEEQQIVFTTIFRTKGLEYDYVLIPQCDENLLPYLKGERSDIFDTQHLVQESLMSNALESERRLFYVALTRARKGVFIGTSTRPSRFLDEMQLPKVAPVMEAVTWLAQGGQ